MNTLRLYPFFSFNQVKTLRHEDKPSLSFMTYEGHGSIYNIIVKDPENHDRKAAYVPLISYACNMSRNPANDSDVACELSITGRGIQYRWLLHYVIVCSF